MPGGTAERRGCFSTSSRAPGRARAARTAAAALACAGVLSISTAARAEPSELPPPFAYNYGENETPRAAALGGALRALGNGTTAMYQNPADLVATRVYHLEALVQLMPEAGRHLYGGTVVDSVTGRLAGGISLIGGFIDESGADRSLIDGRIDLAYPITERFFVGMGPRYLKAWQQGYGPPKNFGASKVSGGLVDPEGGRFALVDAFTFDAGITVRATDALHIGVVGQNLTHPGHGILPTTVGGGVGFGTREFSIEGDGVADFDSYGKPTARFMLGGEYVAGGNFPIRLGYRYDQGASLHSLSGGVGYVGREFSVEGSVRRSLSDPGGTAIVLSIAYFLESSGLTRSPNDFD